MYARTATKKARLGIIRFQRHKRIVPSSKSRSTYLYYADNEPTSTLDASAQQRLAGFMRTHLAEGGLILAASHGSIGLDGAQELRLGQATPSPLAASAPSPLVGEGWGGGSESGAIASTGAIRLTTPTTNPSPQRGGGERKTS